MPVKASISTTETTRVYFVFVSLCLLASMYVYLLRRPQIEEAKGAAIDKNPDNPAVFRHGFEFFVGYWRFATGALGSLSIVAGFIGAFTAFVTTCSFSQPVWSGTVGEWSAMVGAVATAFIAAATTGKLAQNTFWKPVKEE